MIITKRNFAIAFLLGFFCLIWTAQLHAFVPEKGTLLVAKKGIADPRFRDQVILLIQHDSQGTAGLVVNRTSRLPLAAVLPKGSLLAEPGKVLSYGGPVEPKTLLALVKVRNHPPEPSDEIITDLYITGVGVLDEWPDFKAETIDYRAFAGYTGWAPGQLALEMERGDWRVLPADEGSIFSGAGVSLWKTLQKQSDKQD